MAIRITILVFLSNALLAQIGAKVQQNKIFGVWQNSTQGYQMTLILNQDNTGEFDGEVIKFAVSGNKLTITQSGETTNYTFTQQNNSLTLSGGDIEGTITFTRNGSNTEVKQAQTVTEKKTSSTNSNIVGLWSGNNETIEFKS